jgi:ubiquinone/menaquinone biosynthesis C-methylase UbiE
MKATTYDRFNDRFDRAGFAVRRDRLVSTLDGAVLEIGAGTGRNLERYTCADRIVAVEPSAEFRRRLEERAAEVRVPMEVVSGHAESIPLPDNSVDHVVACLTLCSVTSLPAALAECRRVLRPGGTLEFLEHVRSGGFRGRVQDVLTPLQRRFVDGCHLNRDPTGDIEAAGFRISTMEHFAMPPGNPLIVEGIQGRAIRP